MKVLRMLLTGLVLCLVFVPAFAQPATPCNPCVNYCSFTQGGWGTECSGGNPGCLRDQCFDAVYPNGLTIGNSSAYPGGCCWIHFTSSLAIQNFLPQGSTPAVLTANHIDPPQTPHISEFAGQVLALQLNVDLGAYGCGDMIPIGGLEIGVGPFAGMTVSGLLALGNAVLGGDLGALPPGTTIGDLNDALNAVNNNFDNCTENDHYIITPPMGETVIARDFGQELPASFCIEFTGQCGDVCIEWWCPFCGPNDFAHFVACDEGSNVCPSDCPHLTGVEFGDQVVIEADPRGGCWWYTTAHSDVPGCYCISFDYQLAVELMNFTATPDNGKIRLNWATGAEISNEYFTIERSTDNATWATIGRVDGRGTYTGTTNYSFLDNSVNAGATYNYRLMSVDVSGHAMQAGQVSATPNGASAPKEFALEQNYPNPFNPTTSISFSVPTNSHVTLRVFNMIGEEVATLVNGNLNAGSHSITFDASKLPSALYIYRLDAPGFSASHKMLLLK